MAKVNKGDLNLATKIDQKANERRLVEKEINSLYGERNRLVTRLNRTGALGENSADRLNSILEDILAKEKTLQTETNRRIKGQQDLNKSVKSHSAVPSQHEPAPSPAHTLQSSTTATPSHTPRQS